MSPIVVAGNAGAVVREAVQPLNRDRKQKSHGIVSNLHVLSTSDITLPDAPMVPDDELVVVVCSRTERAIVATEFYVVASDNNVLFPCRLYTLTTPPVEYSSDGGGEPTFVQSYFRPGCKCGKR